MKLFEPLVSLVKHPSLYVRGSVSREAYDGLICLSDLRAAQLLLSCSRNNSFPTGNMVSTVFILRDFYFVQSERQSSCIFASDQMGCTLTEDNSDEVVKCY